MKNNVAGRAAQGTVVFQKTLDGFPAVHFFNPPSYRARVRAVEVNEIQITQARHHGMPAVYFPVGFLAGADIHQSDAVIFPADHNFYLG